MSQDKLVIIESIPGRVLSTKDYLNMAESIIKGHPGSMIIIDSVSALADNKELVGGLGTQTRGHNQQVITQFINNNAQLVSANKITLCGIVQKMANTSGYGLSVIEKGAKRWFYQADVLLTVKSMDKWRVGNPEDGKIVGHILKMEARTSSLGQPYSTCDTFLRFGIGIDHEDHHKVFERFYRVSGKEEKTFPGFGIGLFIVNEIISLHEGKIWVDSERDKGSVFYFSLPVHR